MLSRRSSRLREHRNKSALSILKLSFIVSPITAALSHRKACMVRGIPRQLRCAQKRPKKHPARQCKYKYRCPLCRGFDSRWCHWHNPSGLTMALGFTQPLTEMSTRNISWGKWRLVHKVNNLTTFMGRMAWNLEASNSWNPQSLSRPVMGLLYLYLYLRYPL
jgi:hypothetical protein